ncbi:MAG: hypothetical protein FWF79_02990, partial [Defluviitaleaceae bacterium]|nr:hypothetical protein [Defluviitaleaceae bacterium]
NPVSCANIAEKSAALGGFSRYGICEWMIFQHSHISNHVEVYEGCVFIMPIILGKLRACFTNDAGVHIMK